MRTAGSRAPVADAARERGRCGRAGGWRAAGSTRPGRASTGPGPTRWARPPGSGEGGGGGPESRASNEGPHKGFKSRRRPLLGPHPCWKQLLPLSPLRHYAKRVFRHEPNVLNVKAIVAVFNLCVDLQLKLYQRGRTREMV